MNRSMLFDLFRLRNGLLEFLFCRVSMKRLLCYVSTLVRVLFSKYLFFGFNLNVTVFFRCSSLLVTKLVPHATPTWRLDRYNPDEEDPDHGRNVTQSLVINTLH